MYQTIFQFISSSDLNTNDYKMTLNTIKPQQQTTITNQLYLYIKRCTFMFKLNLCISGPTGKYIATAIIFNHKFHDMLKLVHVLHEIRGLQLYVLNNNKNNLKQIMLTIFISVSKCKCKTINC